MQISTRALGYGIVMTVLLALGGCGGGGGSDEPSVMPALLNDTEISSNYWESNTASGLFVMLVQFYSDGDGYAVMDSVESAPFVNNDAGNTGRGYVTTWDEPSGGNVVVTFVPDSPGFGIRFTNIVIAEDEESFTARATADDDTFLDLVFTRRDGSIDPA